MTHTQAPADLLADLNANAGSLPPTPELKVKLTPEIEAWLGALPPDEAAKARAAMGLPEPTPEPAPEPTPEPTPAPEPTPKPKGRPRAKSITAEHADRLITVLERIADAIEKRGV